MKRSITERDQYENLTMANCLMLRSGRSRIAAVPEHHHHHIEYYSSPPCSSPSRVFECKTCNRQFTSFQALGGHRASHKKPRPSEMAEGSDGAGGGSPAAKPKAHECTVCGLEFAIGQALGGHMRRHRAAMADQAHHLPHLLTRDAIDISGKSGRRVLYLDLNLTPLENDIKILQLGKPLVNIF